ncbi:MAG: hypothetical protein LBP87_10315, partial [Planctomycetaceae bacterium]|nr:hypothetical protein [Planctomycetaceae bacterium]
RKLLQIANNKDFDPHGSIAVAKIYAEAKKYWQDENVVAESLENWKNSEIPQNNKNLHALWNGNDVSIALLIKQLGETHEENEINKILAVILSFGTEGRECLAAALNSDRPALVFNAARGLAGSIHADEIFLLYPALFADSPLSNEQRNQIAETLRQRNFKLPDKDSVSAAAENVSAFADSVSAAAESAAAELLKRSRDYLEKKRSLKPAFDGFVRFWNWDEKEKNVKYIRMMLPAAYRFFAYRYAAQAYKIKPEIEEIQRFYLLTFFERAAYLNGLDKPFDLDATGLNATLAKTEPDPKQQQVLLQQILLDAMAKEYYAAAQVAVVLLGISKNRELLQPAPNGKPCPLVQAVVAKNRRVRFAALEAIMTIQPEQPYSGSSFVAETLVWFSRADGQRILVSAHPKLSNAAKTAGFFIGCGYRGELAQTCRDAMKLAAETPDTELVVVDSRTPEPAVANFVQEMRKDARTADIPIAVLTNAAAFSDEMPNYQNRSEMQKIDQLQPAAPFALSLSQTYPVIVNDDGAKWLNDDLLGKTDVEPVPTVVRIEQAHKSLGWLKTIVEAAQNGQKIYHIEELDDVVFRALRSDVRIGKGLELAAVVKSNAVQAAIYEIAANSLQPIELRRKAAENFGKSLDAFGVLLRGQQIQHLYDRYNASEFESKETQELLGNIIDLVEKKYEKK